MGPCAIVALALSLTNLETSATTERANLPSAALSYRYHAAMRVLATGSAGFIGYHGSQTPARLVRRWDAATETQVPVRKATAKSPDTVQEVS